jgi:ribosomal-protein-alanine N-acetyltransferase
MLPVSPSRLPRLATARLVVRTAEPDDVPGIVRYYLENREFLRPWEPSRPDSFFAEEFWRARVEQDRQELLTGRSLRLFLFPADEPRTVAGVANFTQIVRGAFQGCTLGYNLAEARQGQGLMTEALGAAIDFVFGRLGLHRVQANYMPHNRRSGALLRRLGFTVEGYARDYLLIDGRWEDHVLTSLTHPQWDRSG